MNGTTGNGRREKGQLAEDLAVQHLTRNGYRIIKRNFVCNVGEIDIIAHHQGDLVFVEVRSRNSPSDLDPVYSINRRKQKKIIKVAELYLSRHHRQPVPARFDVVLVTLGNSPIVELIQNAFTADTDSYWP